MSKYGEKEILQNLEVLSQIKPSSEATEQAIERARHSLLKRSAIEKTQKPGVLLGIMKSKWTKIAAAAAAVIVVIATILYFHDSSTSVVSKVAWAEVKEQFEHDIAKHYAVFMEITDYYRPNNRSDKHFIWMKPPSDCKIIFQDKTEMLITNNRFVRINHRNQSYVDRDIRERESTSAAKFIESSLSEVSPLNIIGFDEGANISDGIPLGKDIVEGQETTIYEFVASPPINGRRIKIWLRNSDKLTVRAEIYEKMEDLYPGGPARLKLAYNIIRYNPEIPKGTFEITIPEEYRNIIENPASQAEARAVLLYKISIAIRDYARDNNGQLPKELSELIPAYLKDEKMITSAISGKPFFYTAAQSIEDNPLKIIVWDPSRDENGSCAVLQVCGSIMTLTPELFKEKLKGIEKVNEGCVSDMLAQLKKEDIEEGLADSDIEIIINFSEPQIRNSAENSKIALSVDDIINAMESSSSMISDISVRFDRVQGKVETLADGTLMFVAGSFVSKPDGTQWFEKGNVGIFNCLWKEKGQKEYLYRQHRQFSEPLEGQPMRIVEGKSCMCWDGVKGRYSTGGVSSKPNGNLRSPYTLPLLFTNRLWQKYGDDPSIKENDLGTLSELFKRFKDKVEIISTNAEIEGNQCVEILLRDHFAKGINEKYWLDMERGFNLVRFEQLNFKTGKPGWIVTCKLEEVAPGIWFPVEGLGQEVAGNKGADWYRATKVEVNQNLPDSDFTVVFPYPKMN